MKSEIIADRQADNAAGSNMLHHIKKSDSASFNPYIEFDINRDLPGMDVIEHEKLEWMKDVTKPSYKKNKVDFKFYKYLMLELSCNCVNCRLVNQYV